MTATVSLQTRPLFIIPDVRSLFEAPQNDWRDPDWHLAGLRRMLRIFNPHTRFAPLPLVIIGAAPIEFGQLMTPGFKTVWRRYVAERQHTGFGGFNVCIRQDRRSENTFRLLSQPRADLPILEFRFMCSDLFSVDNPWKAILAGLPYGFDLAGWPDCSDCHPADMVCDLESHMSREHLPHGRPDCAVSALYSLVGVGDGTRERRYPVVRPPGH